MLRCVCIVARLVSQGLSIFRLAFDKYLHAAVQTYFYIIRCMRACTRIYELPSSAKKLYCYIFLGSVNSIDPISILWYRFLFLSKSLIKMAHSSRSVKWEKRSLFITIILKSFPTFLMLYRAWTWFVVYLIFIGPISCMERKLFLFKMILSTYL